MKKIICLFFVFAALAFISASAPVYAASPDNIPVENLDSSHSSSEAHPLPTPYMVIPFIVLLLMIASGPVLYHHFWDKFYPLISIVLGLITAAYYFIILHDPSAVLHSVVEYLSFIALLSSLFVASGGILIKVDKKATPVINVLFFLFGAVISNVIGTTGASMLLIRPFIKINKGRIKPYHIIFFIFVVSNTGGALTPIGDPPLFLGFLRGVPFFWVIQHVWYIWIPTILMILLIFYLIDSRNKSGETSSEEYSGRIEFRGIKNVIFLLIIVISVFIDPGVMSWVPSLHPFPLGIREIIMFSMVYIAYKFADQSILKSNEFDFGPIKEVAYLFVGIFLTMIPALQLIAYESKVLHDHLNATTFYWATGTLSSFLDNAPTYLNFLSAAMGKFGLDVNSMANVKEFVIHDEIYLQAISVAAVFFGACTYIGNGPNFMVKSISERSGIQMPSFFAYMYKYSLPVLIPVYFIIWLIFFNA
ncbi:MAG TPA: sodium:proton antiporter [Ignavibacteriaceae bacterium]|nr:sodium:proton antiporter [Ignavibacteriaceae bacterium]